MHVRLAVNSETLCQHSSFLELLDDKKPRRTPIKSPPGQRSHAEKTPFIRRPSSAGPTRWDSLLDGRDLDESEFGSSQSAKRGSTEVDHTTLPDQALGWTAIGDDNYDAGVCGRDAYTRSQRIEPTRGGERVWIEGATVGHQLSAMLLPIPTRRIGPQIHADDAERNEQRG